MQNLFKSFHGKGARLREKGKAGLDAVKSFGRPNNTPSSSRTPPACGSTVLFTNPAVPPPGAGDISSTSATEASDTCGSASLAPAPSSAPVAGAQETPDLGEVLLDTQEQSLGSERQLFVIAPQISISQPELHTELTSENTVTTPNDVLGPSSKDIPTTQFDPPIEEVADVECPSTDRQEVSTDANSSVPSSSNEQSQIAEQETQPVKTLSLWEEAWKKLPEDVRKHFQFILDETDNNGSGAAKQLLAVTTEIRGICEKEKLVDTIDDGKRSKRIIVRDLADKLISWVSKFVAVGDTLIQYDPGHAAIPWAIIRFLLQCAIIHKERMAEIVSNTEYLGRLMVRCVAYEELYLVPKSRLCNYCELKQAVEQLYQAILGFFVETAKHLHRKTLGRILKAILEPEALRELLQKVKYHEQLLGGELELAQRNASQIGFADAEHNHKQLMQLLEDLEKPIQRVVSDLQACYQFAEAQTRGDALNWITSNEYQAPHNLALQGLLEDTGKWFFDRIEYKEWRSASTSSMLWLHGIPGSGKTKLTCQVIKSLGSTNPNEALCFFYCKRDGEASRRKPLTVLQAIIRQLSLCQPDGLPNEIFIRYSKDRKSGFPAGKSGALQWDDCKELLLSLLNMYPQTTIIIDALDELDLDYESKHRHLLLELLNDVVLQCESLVKIFVASRDDQDIVMEFKKVPNLFIRATDNLKDIERYILREFEIDKRFTRHPWSSELKNIVYAELCKKASGMFQWVKLQLQFLISMKTERDIQQKLGKAPKDLTAAYDQIYALIKGEEDYGCETAKCALMWITCTMKPLTMEILLEATRYATGSQDEISAETLLDLCRNLLTWDKSEKSNVVQFAHLSVKEYLISGKWTEVEAHAMAAKSCLTTLIEKPHGSPSYGQITSFLEYADYYWLEHVSKDSVGPSHKTFKEPLCSFLGSPGLPNPSYANWVRGMYNRRRAREPTPEVEKGLYDYYSQPPNPLFLAAACPFLLEFADEFWPQWECFDLHIRNTTETSLLYIAACNGNSAVVTRLLTHEEINVNVGKKTGEYTSTPLFAAATSGHAQIVQQLLAHSAVDVNMKGEEEYTGTPLFVAAAEGQAEIVQQLLAHSAVDVNMKGEDEYGFTSTPLFVAAAKGQAEIVQQLLAHSAVDVNMEGEVHYMHMLEYGITGTPLFVAVAEGQAEIVQQLLAHSAVDVNMKGEEEEEDRYTGTPLFAAAAKGRAEIVQQLLAHSAVDVNMKGEEEDGFTGTPLFVAAAKGQAEIVQQLLAHSAVDVNMKGMGEDDGYTGTPLFVAAAQGHVEVVQQLLTHSAVNVNMKGEHDGYTGTPLFVVAAQGHAEVVQQLLAHSAIDVNLQGNGGETALLRAARKGNETMFRQLVRHPAINPHLRNKKGETVLMIAIAAKQQSTEILEWSLDHCDVNSQNNEGETALFIAANSGNERIVQQLLAHDTTDANLITAKGETPLTVATRKGHVKVVRLLLEHCSKFTTITK